MVKRVVGLVVIAIFILTGSPKNAPVDRADLKNSIMYVVTDRLGSKYFLYSLKGTKKSLVAETRNEISANLINEKQLLVRRVYPTNTRTGTIFLTDLTGRVQKRIARGNRLSYLKTKKILVFTSDHISSTGSYFVFAKDLKKRKIRQLTFLPKGVKNQNTGYMYEGDWDGDMSKDGRHLIYLSTWYHQGDKWPKDFDLLVKNLSTGATSKLASLVLSAGKFSNKGSKICFIDKQGSVVVIDVDGKQLHKFQTKRFKRRPRSWPFDNLEIDWSQDDSQLIIRDASAIFQLSVKDGSIKNLVRLKGSKQTIYSVAPFDD